MIQTGTIENVQKLATYICNTSALSTQFYEPDQRLRPDK